MRAGSYATTLNKYKQVIICLLLEVSQRSSYSHTVCSPTCLYFAITKLNWKEHHRPPPPLAPENTIFEYSTFNILHQFKESAFKLENDRPVHNLSSCCILLPGPSRVLLRLYAFKVCHAKYQWTVAREHLRIQIQLSEAASPAETYPSHVIAIGRAGESEILEE